MIELDRLFHEIARKHLLIDTLERRSRDCLDFHDLPVWSIQAALLAAYQAGLAAGRRTAPGAVHLAIGKHLKTLCGRRRDDARCSTVPTAVTCRRCLKRIGQAHASG